MGGKPAQPEIRTIQMPAATPPPPIAPIPSPSPRGTPSQLVTEARRRKIRQARYGILSTIKTSPLGIVGAGAELGPGRGKTSLGT